MLRVSWWVDLSLAPPQGQYRTALYNHWVKNLMMHHVPHTSEPTLIGTLGNPVKIRSWQVHTQGDWSNWTGPVAWSKLGQGPPTSIPPSFLDLLRGASPEPTQAQQEGGG